MREGGRTRGQYLTARVSVWDDEKSSENSISGYTAL